MNEPLPRKPTKQEYEQAWCFIQDQALLVRHNEKYWAVYKDSHLPIPEYMARLWRYVKLELERRQTTTAG